MYELNVHSICMSIILFNIAIKYFWKTWKKSGKIMEFQNENLVATLLGELSHGEVSDPSVITHLLKMSKCELSLKSIAHSQFFSNDSFTYFWESFHLVKFQTRS